MKKSKQEDLLSSGFSVLTELLKGTPSRGLTHVAADARLAKSTTHRILKILCSLNFVEQAKESRQYYISPLLFQFMHKIIELSYPNRNLHDLIKKESAATNCTFFMSVLRRRQ